MRQFGLIGKTLQHSFSKTYFTQKFAQLGLKDCSYDNYELPNIEQLKVLLENPSLEGFNITIPYKEAVLSFLDYKNTVVVEVGACNCVRIRGGKLYGYNTDVIGFEQSLQPFLKPHHTKAFILGTGGAAKAVGYVLTKLGIEFQFVSRTTRPGCISYEQLDQTFLKAHTLIINTTPVGTFPAVEDAPALPYHLLSNKHLLFDLIYNPAKTMFLQKGEAQGAAIGNGQHMLVVQAEESWKIWNA